MSALIACRQVLLELKVLESVRGRLSAYLGIGSLIVSWNVAGCILDLVGETANACQTVIDGIISFTTR